MREKGLLEFGARNGNEFSHRVPEFVMNYLIENKNKILPSTEDRSYAGFRSRMDKIDYEIKRFIN
jgi:hypothetical protein